METLTLGMLWRLAAIGLNSVATRTENGENIWDGKIPTQEELRDAFISIGDKYPVTQSGLVSWNRVVVKK